MTATQGGTPAAVRQQKRKVREETELGVKRLLIRVPIATADDWKARAKAELDQHLDRLEAENPRLFSRRRPNR